MCERIEYEKPAILEELTEEERRDLENLRRVKSGEVLKHVERDYVIYNGEWYRTHRWDWPKDDPTEARLMTLEEYKVLAELPPDERVPVWEEWRRHDSKWAMPGPAYNGYGMWWRCWTSRPTEAQRAAEAWPDPGQA